MNNQVKIFISVIVILILGVFASVLLHASTPTTSSSSPYLTLAQCLKDKGATFYGAFWCPHCQAQEKEFQMSRSDLAKIGLYHECALPDGSGQNQSCNDKKIQSYPTWEFADGSRLTGEIPLAQLADKVQCVAPGGATEVPAPVNTGAASPVK